MGGNADSRSSPPLLVAGFRGRFRPGLPSHDLLSPSCRNDARCAAAGRFVTGTIRFISHPDAWPLGIIGADWRGKLGQSLCRENAWDYRGRLRTQNAAAAAVAARNRVALRTEPGHAAARGARWFIDFAPPSRAGPGLATARRAVHRHAADCRLDLAKAARAPPTRIRLLDWRGEVPAAFGVGGETDCVGSGGAARLALAAWGREAGECAGFAAGPCHADRSGTGEKTGLQGMPRGRCSGRIAGLRIARVLLAGDGALRRKRHLQPRRCALRIAHRPAAVRRSGPDQARPSAPAGGSNRLA